MKLPILSFCPRFFFYKKNIINLNLLYNILKFKKNYCFKKNKRLVKGSGKKPWQQKGTGRARAGDKKSPIWRGGGVTFSNYLFPNKKKINIFKEMIIILLISNNFYIYNINENFIFFFLNKKNLIFNKRKISKIKINDFFNFEKFFFDEKSFIYLINNYLK